MTSGIASDHRAGPKRRRPAGVPIAILAILAISCASTPKHDESFSPDEGSGAFETVGLGAASVLGTLIYAPFKLAYAASGIVMGGATWLFTGGNEDAAASVAWPALLGDYVITPDSLRNPSSIAFRGTWPGVEEPGQQWAGLPPVGAAPPGSCSAADGIEAVRFEINDASLQDSARDALDEVASRIRGCGPGSVHIQGYADSTGAPELNLALSSRRAQAVKSYLVRHGVDPKILATKAFGESRPIASNATREGRAQNRRVEIPIAP